MVDDTKNKIIYDFRNALLKKAAFESFARNMYQTDTVTLGLCYIEDLIFLKNDIVWIWTSLDVQSTGSSVEWYNKLWDTSTSSQVSNCDGVVLQIYLYHKFKWPQEGLNCKSFA